MKEMMLWEGGPRYRSDEQMPLTTDAVLLADFTRTRTGERGADLGCGSGILMLLLLWREKELRMTGLELRREACAFARENIERNGLGDRAEVMQGDLRETVKRLPNGGFDFVISNPPYYGTGQGKLPADRDRAAATAETALSLPEVCRAASRLCRSGGRAARNPA